MAEFTELDGMLRDALQRAAQPGDSTGVADAIRSRVAAGDPGTSVAASTAPGWGGGVSGWLPWLGLIVLAGIGGTALGASGVIAGEPREILAGYTAVLDDSAPAASCPGGPVIDELFAGDRVLAIARSEDSGYLGVRDPNDFARTLWFDRAVVVVDAGQADVDGLPIEACPVATVEVIEPTHVPTEEPEPEPEPEPQPVPQPGDTVPPILGQQYASPHTTLYGGYSTTIYAFSTDNVATTQVRISWAGVASGNGTMTKGQNNQWTFAYAKPNGAPDGKVTFTLVARDAAGNQSPPVTVDLIFDTLI
jgi:hypothetical protein